MSFVHSNTLYIHGGEDFHEGILDSMWSLDLNFLEQESEQRFRDSKKPQWKRISIENSKTNPGALSRHSIVLFNNGAYLYGGLRENGVASADFFKFDLKS